MRLRNIPGAKDAIAESIYVIQNPQENKGNWDKVFSQNQPVHLEVGMGKGRFLMDMAKLHPEINYIGIEMYDSVLLRAIQKKEALAEEGQELSNLKFMRMDARLLPEVFEKGEVSRIYLNFSCFCICMNTECRILFSKLCKSLAHLILSGFCLRLDCDIDNRLWEYHGLKDYRMLLVTDCITSRCGLEANSCCDITGVNLVKLVSLVCMHLKNTSNTLFFVFCCI